jgi:hypothetical protein
MLRFEEQTPSARIQLSSSATERFEHALGKAIEQQRRQPGYRPTWGTRLSFLPDLRACNAHALAGKLARAVC